MQRLTARSLVLVALVGSFAPLALAVTAAPAHACCLHKGHRCQCSAVAESDRLAIHASCCCSGDCCHAVTTAQGAHPQPQATPAFSPQVEARIAESHPAAPPVNPAASPSARAPPADFTT